MSAFINQLAARGPFLLGAVSIVMVIGLSAILLHRSPAKRQRIGEASVFAILILVVLSLIPLPRTGIGQWIGKRIDAIDQGASSLPMTENAIAAETNGQTEQTPRQHHATFGNEHPAESNPARADQSGPLSMVPTVASAQDSVPPETHGQEFPLVAPPQLSARHSVEQAIAESPRSANDQAADNPVAAAVSQFAVSQFDETRRSQNSTTAKTQKRTSTTDGSFATMPPFAEQSVARIDANTVSAWIFLAGFCASVGWIFLGRIQLLRVVRASKLASDSVQQLARSFLSPDPRTSPVSRRVRVLVSNKLHRPVTFGIWRPVIALPTALVRGGGSGSLADVLRHECVHVNRRDAVGQAAFNLALPLVWFHPLYWLLRRRVQWAAELIADDRAASMTSPAEYVEHLVRLVRRRRCAPLAAGSALSLFSSQTQFSRRMEMLMKRTARLSTTCSRAWKATLTVFVCAAAVLASDIVGGRANAAAQQAQQQDKGILLKRLAAMEDQVAQLKEVLVQMQKESTVAKDVAEEHAVRAAVAKQQAAEMAKKYDDMLAVLEAKTNDQNVQLQQQLMATKHAMANSEAQAEELMVELQHLRDENALLRQELQKAKDGGDRDLLDAAAGQFVGSDDNAGLADGPPSPRNAADSEDLLAGLIGSRTIGGATGLASGRTNSSGSTSVNLANLDLMSLATNLAEVQGEMRKAEIELDQLRRVVEGGNVSKHALAIAEIDLETAHRKFALYRSLAEHALAATENQLQMLHQNLERTRQLAEKGYVTEKELAIEELQIAQTEAQLQIIKELMAR